jgi:maltooligosyltrehalose trehalohydrolase
VLELYRALIALRAAEPDLRDGDLTQVAVDFDERGQWLDVHRGAFRVAANLAETEQRLPLEATEIVLATGPVEVGAGSLVVGPRTAAIVRVP